MKSICLVSGDYKASCQAESRASKLQVATSCRTSCQAVRRVGLGVARASEQASVAAGAPVPASTTMLLAPLDSVQASMTACVSIDDKVF